MNEQAGPVIEAGRAVQQNARADTESRTSVTARLTYDRTSAMQGLTSGSQGSGSSRWSFDRDSFDRDSFSLNSLRGSVPGLEDYLRYAQLLPDGDSYYYSLTASMNGAGEQVPFSAPSEGGESGFSDRFGNLSGSWGTRYGSDFRVVGYSSYGAMLPLFGEDGTHIVVSGSVFDETSPTPACMISSELALFNGLNVGVSVSVPVTNALLEQQIEKAEAASETVSSNFGLQGGSFGSILANRFNDRNGAGQVDYVTSVSSATDLTVISSLAAMVSITRYEPLRILADRS